MLLFVLVLAAAGAVDGGFPSATSPSSLNEQARFIAGLANAQDSVLAKLEVSAGWQKHAAALDAGWSKLESKRLEPMAKWAAQEVVPALDAKLPLINLFGGPDAIRAPAAPVAHRPTQGRS